jgi:hypothetical protein
MGKGVLITDLNGISGNLPCKDDNALFATDISTLETFT